MSRNKEHRPNGAAAPLGAPPKAAPLCSLFLLIYFLIVWIFMDIPYIFLIYSTYIYIYVLNIFHIFSFICFVIYSANTFKSNFLIRGVVFREVKSVLGKFSSCGEEEDYAWCIILPMVATRNGLCTLLWGRCPICWWGCRCLDGTCRKFAAIESVCHDCQI